jgi:hypothetical protein
MTTPTLPDCQAYLASVGLTYTTEAVTDALTAETVAQANVCRVGDPMPADLAQALKRRVARNLTMRAVPLGVMSNETGATPLGSNDPEIRRLEKPFRKVVMG